MVGRIGFGIAGLNNFGAVVGSGISGVFEGVSLTKNGFSTTSYANASFSEIQFRASKDARTSDNTHGKQKGVKYIIKVL